MEWALLLRLLKTSGFVSGEVVRKSRVEEGPEAKHEYLIQEMYNIEREK
jgi:hypothetical protein